MQTFLLKGQAQGDFITKAGSHKDRQHPSHGLRMQIVTDAGDRDEKGTPKDG